MRNRLLIVALVLLTGCGLFVRTGVAILYKPASLAQDHIRRDVCYRADSACDGPRQTLDLYLPDSKNPPTLLFVHGGSWTSGDKQLKVGGADVYANIGRFYASNGVAVAVMNYRYQPTVQWRDQVADVAEALKWVNANAPSWSGKADSIFLMGHSAGAELISFLALSASEKAGVPIVNGVIAVSGAGYDMTDQETYRLGADPTFYAQRFQSKDGGAGWEKAASPIFQIGPHAPPFLVLVAGGESKALQRQATLFEQALQDNHTPSKRVTVPGESHTRIVLTLSRDDKTAGPEILGFIEKNVASTAPTISFDGYGPIKIGMTVDQLSTVAGSSVGEKITSPECSQFGLSRWPGMVFMVTAQHLARLDTSSPGIQTAGGISVGDTERRVKEIYGARLAVSPEKYGEGNILAVTSDDKKSKILFQTDGDKVIRIRTGQMPEVEWVEGCS